MKYFLFACLLFAAACNNSSEKTKTESSGNSSAENIARGEKLFKIHCALCHKPAEDFTGPALKGAAENWKDKQLLYDFVRNSADVIQREEYAKKLFEKYKQSPMPPFPQLTDEEIEDILQYCNSER